MAIVDKIIDVLDSFVVRPIGLYNKDYRFIIEHLDRNIGNADFDNADGFGTPIGQLSNPYLNAQLGQIPWYYADSDKMKYANYLDYIKQTFGSSLSLENINYDTPFPVDFDSVKIGKITGDRLNASLTNLKKPAIFNPNSIENDTNLGKISAEIARQTMLTSIKENDKHNAKRFAISSQMIDYFGLNSEAQKNGILERFTNVDETTGRYSDINLLGEDISPVYTDGPKWGNYKGLGIYEGYYESSPKETTRSYYDDNIKLNKYKPNTPENPKSDANYLDRMKIAVSKGTDYTGSQIRYIFETLHTSDTTYNNEGHTTGSLIGGLKAYGEDEAGKAHSYKFTTFNPGINFGKYSTFDTDPIGVDDLLSKTNEGFVNGKYDTLIARFHTSTDYPNDDLMSSSVSKAYGMSHGRNLLRGDAKNGKTFTKDGVGNGYDNPYCRVWTYHHQYHRLKDAIRPFVENEPEGSTVLTPKEMQDSYGFGAFRNGDTVGMGTGGARLTKFGALGYKTNGGLVNIAPKKGVDIKNCMFSIENLAWKGMFSTSMRKTYEANSLSPEQKGPFGGRIMWFPPYDLKFSENITTNWNSTSFIGRGEDVYTYTNTARDGQLSFKLLIDHPAILDYWKRRKETDGSSNVDDVDAPEQQLLRFFAGCEMLSSKNPPKKVSKPVKKEQPKKSPSFKKFTFFVFYPNDYSGQDDVDNNLALTYLLNGVGTQYQYSSQNGSVRDNPLMTVWKNTSGKQIGGYEVRTEGISVVKNSIKASDTKNPNRKSYVTSVLYNDNKKYDLAKLIGDYKGKRIEWYYRVDKKRRNEKLVYNIDYIDTKSYRLNSGGNQESIRKTFNLSKTDKLYPLTDAYIALTNDTKAKNILKGYYNEKNISEIKKTIEEYGIKEITIKGWASSHGITKNVSRNTDLNQNRSNTVKQWLRKCPIISKSNVQCKIIKGGIGPGPAASNVSDLKPKLYRCAEITVYINTEAVKNSQKSYTEKNVNSTDAVNTANYLTGKTSTVKKQILNKSSDNTISEVENNNVVRRYDNETEFFKGLTLNDPVMRHKITEKIKYFDPAFHSISPEGFNARLNFLQQCTRQGPTVGGSDLTDKIGLTANNLSFGRPPVCVLRIGDFYYTKIIITSISIDYDPLQWDLNSEGIGVMPMIANISLSFHFIGGSNLSGPISRLQNAISFNYYANTEVYDDRAEQVDYDNNGEVSKFKTFPY